MLHACLKKTDGICMENVSSVCNIQLLYSDVLLVSVNFGGHYLLYFFSSLTKRSVYETLLASYDYNNYMI